MKKNDANTNNIDTGSKIASFKVKQNMPYEFKVNYARIRAWEFIEVSSVINEDVLHK